MDNALDVWVRFGKTRNIRIKVTLNKVQQTIAVEDDAAGLAKDDLRYVVGPGQTGSTPTDETIGIFGVGTQRAVVALAQFPPIADTDLMDLYRDKKFMQSRFLNQMQLP